MASNPPFRWNVKAGQYVRANGRFVSRAEVRSAIDAILNRERRNIRELTIGLRNGDISLDAWRSSMFDIIKSIHLYDAAAARGGWAQLTQADFGRIGNIIKSEYKYLERYARQIAAGTAQIDVTRAMMYADAGRQTYHQVERFQATKSGYRYERNLLHAGDHCGGCLAETARGWVKIGVLSPIGTRNCLRNCHCTLQYSKAKG